MRKDLTFATDVATRVKNAGKMNAGDKAKTLFGYVALINVAAFFFLSKVVRTWLGVPPRFVFLFLIGCDVLIGIWYVNTFVVREVELLQETKEAKKDSFTRFVKILGDTDNETKVFNSTVYTQMFNDGSMFNVVEVLFGKGTTELYQGNEQFFERLYKLAYAYRMEIRSTVTREDFSKSPEYASWIAEANDKTFTSASPFAMEILQSITNESNKVADVPAIYFQFRTLSSQDNENLIEFNRQVLNMFAATSNSIRCLKFLQFEEVIDYLQEFHLVGAINLDVGKASDYAVAVKESLVKAMDSSVTTVAVVKQSRTLDPTREISQFFELEEVKLNNES